MLARRSWLVLAAALAAACGPRDHDDSAPPGVPVLAQVAAAPPPAPVLAAPAAAGATADATGAVALSRGSPVLTTSSGTRFVLEGPRAADLAARLGLGAPDEARGHAVRVRGTRTHTASGARSIVVTDAAATDAYTARTLAPGVVWRRHTFPRLFGARQTIQFLEVDPARPGVSLGIAAAPAGRGLRTSALGAREHARAAVNGGFFDTRHVATGILKVAGRVEAVSPAAKPARGAFGLDVQGRGLVGWVPPASDWPQAHEAVGAGPNLVTAGVPDVTNAREGYLPAFATARHPRTAAGVRPSGVVVLLVADGRHQGGAGLTLQELARLLVVLGCDKAVNLDGGGSTTMWIDGQPHAGVVNTPTDGTERRVGNAIVVRAP